MYWVKKGVFKVMLVMLLSFSFFMTSGSITSVTVEAATVKAPTVKSKAQTLYVGYKSYTIGINNLAKGAVVTYKSSNSKYASVTSKGVVKPVAEGKASITAIVKQNKKTYSLKVSIKVLKPYIEFTQSSSYLNVGETTTFKAKAYGTDSKIVWSASSLDVVTVSSSGRVTALKGGTVTIYAEAGKATVKCVMNIGTNRIGTFSKDVTIYDDYEIWISVTDMEADESIYWDSTSDSVITCRWVDQFNDANQAALVIMPLAYGTDTITITSDKTNDELIINVTVIDIPEDKQGLSSVDIGEKCSPLTVEITVDADGEQYLGSGFFVGDGMLVTNYHVIKGAEKVVAQTYDGKQFPINTIIGYNKDIDLAILSIDKENDYLAISKDEIKIGQEIYTFGSPLGLTGTMSKGMVSSASRVIDGVDYIQIDAPISPGNSGGPLVNSYGEVIGINTMYIENGQNLNFAINIRELQKINTNKPISVVDYHTQYEDQSLADFMSNAIYEDPLKSQSVNSCQVVPSDAAVLGTLTSTEYGDLYSFTMEQSGYFEAFIIYDNEIDLKNTFFGIISEDVSWEWDAEQTTDTMAQLSHELSPGKYYIAVGHMDENYYGNDIDYMFYTTKTYD